MKTILMLILKKVGTELLLYILKELVKILENRRDNNFGESDYLAIERRVEIARDAEADPLQHPDVK